METLVYKSRIKDQIVPLVIRNSEQLVPSLTMKDHSVRLFIIASSNVMQGNTLLGTIVPKSSIKDQFVPLETRNWEQLVPLLAINDHFVPKKY